MAPDAQEYEVGSHTDLEISPGILTEYELRELRHLGVFNKSSKNNYQLESASIDTTRLREIAFEHAILKEIANSVEVEVMKYFRQTSHDRVTTKEIVESLDRPSSTISRVLGNLTEKGQIRKIQQGLYESR